ncbi:MAG: HD domain-containing protein [Cytophagales bacterium]
MEPLTHLLIIFLMVNLAVGLYYSQGIKTLKGYAIGEGKTHIWLLAVTIAATWTTGSGVLMYLTQSFKEEVDITVLIIASLTLVFVGFFVLRMGEFLGTLSIAGAMERLYGQRVARITGVAAFACCVGKLAGQLHVFSTLAAKGLGVDPTGLLVILSTLVVVYSALGGIRAIMLTNLFQFVIMALCLPAGVYLLYSYLGPQMANLSYVPEGGAFMASAFLKGPRSIFSDMTRYVEFLLMGFMPPLFQRCLMHQDLLKTRKAFRRAAVGFVYLLVSIVLMGRMLATDQAGLESKNLLESTFSKYPYVGFKTLITFVLMAAILSSADAYINTCAVLLADISKKKSLFSVRLFSALTGALGLGVVFFSQGKDITTLLYLSSLFYAPVFPVLLLALLGFRSSERTALIAIISSVLVALGMGFAFSALTAISVSMLTNLVMMLGAHYLLGEPGGWVGIKDKEPLIAHAQLQRRKWDAIRNFKLGQYLRNSLPKNEAHYLLFGFYVLTFVFGSIFFLPREVLQSSKFQWLPGSLLLINAIVMTYPSWPKEMKKQRFIAPTWAFSTGYILFYVSGLLLLLGGFQLAHVILLGVNLTLAMILLRHKLVGTWLLVATLTVVPTYCGMGYAVFLSKAETTLTQLLFALAVTLAGARCLYGNKQRHNRFTKHLTLGNLQQATEEALRALYLKPDHFAQKLVQKNHAKVASAYEMSKVILGASHELTNKIAESTWHLAKTLQTIQTQAQLEPHQYLFCKFLKEFYDFKPDLNEAGLILYNQAKRKQIKWDVEKVYQLLYKTYHHFKAHHPEVPYSYLYVRDTHLNYPIHKTLVPAVALTFVFRAGKEPVAASKYTYVERIPDPYLVANRHLYAMQGLADKHYAHLDLTQAPDEALLVLPIHIDKVRSKAIDNWSEPSQGLKWELFREAKFIEGEFWVTICQYLHYNIPEIEQVVHFMKAAHQHQIRQNKAPHYAHLISIAKYVSEYDLRPHMLISALLHDIVKDTNITLEEIGIRFGAEVAHLVKLVSNTDWDTLKKYRDAILIKACAQIHNLNILTEIPYHKQVAKAEETLTHYVPMVQKMGFPDLAYRLVELAKPFL